jgi:hypothetical protein
MKTRRKEITLENYAETRGPGLVGEKEVDWFHLLQDRNKLRSLANGAVTFGFIICREFDLITNY